MNKIIVADTGPLIALALVRLLPVLPKLFSEIYAPNEVIHEALHDPIKPGAIEIKKALDAGWLIQRSVVITAAYQDLVDSLDQGEAEALALAEELNAVVLIDERRGRKVAASRNIPVTGSAAVLIKAKKAGLIPAIKPILMELSNHGYRLSPVLVREILKLCGETP